jgi:hypothetical protein
MMWGRFQRTLVMSVCTALVGGLLMITTATTPASAAVTGQLVVRASTTEAGSNYQTLTYISTVMQSGNLSFILMDLPNTATAWPQEVRTTSGTVEVYPNNRLLWRPSAPYWVGAGAHIEIPVTGIDLGGAGTTSLRLAVFDSAGIPFSQSYGSFTITPAAYPCVTPTRDYIQRENAKTGVANRYEWDIPLTQYERDTVNGQPDPNGNYRLSGYAASDSTACGQKLYIKMRSVMNPMVNVTVYRMGYYGGSGARQIWASSGPIVITAQSPAKVLNSSADGYKNMADASHWRWGFALSIDGRYVPGTYLAKVTEGTRATLIPFTVRDDSGVKHDYLLQQATSTWQAYNAYGGYSFYSMKTVNGVTIPDGSSRLSYNRPYDNPQGRGTGEFLQLEQGLVYYMEKRGLDVAYWTDTDLNQRGDELSNRTRTLVIPAHDEYYSWEMRGALLDGINNTNKPIVNLISLGANQIHREIYYTPNGRYFDVKNMYTEVRKNSDYVVTTWRRRLGQYNEQFIVGAQYGAPGMGDLVINSGDNFFAWKGIPAGTILRGFINGEADHIDLNNQGIYNAHPELKDYPVPYPNGQVTRSALYPMYYHNTADHSGMQAVGRVTPKGAKVFNGSTFAYGCFVTDSCPYFWKQGRPGQQTHVNPPTQGLIVPEPSPNEFAALQVTPQEQVYAEKILDNIFTWQRSG